jgi:hypothetical protein
MLEVSLLNACFMLHSQRLRILEVVLDGIRVIWSQEFLGIAVQLILENLIWLNLCLRNFISVKSYHILWVLEEVTVIRNHTNARIVLEWVEVILRACRV